MFSRIGRRPRTTGNLVSMSPARATSSPSPRRFSRRAPHRGVRRRGRRLLAVGLALGLAALPPLGGEPTAAASDAAGGGVLAPTAALAVGGPRTPAPRGRYGWPTGGPTDVLEGFDPPAAVWSAGHRGVDLALAAGSPVLAAGDGTVIFAGVVAGRPVVSIDHADGIRTTYEPVEPSVAAGDAVRRGQAIGVLVAGHRSDGADALHWGARTGAKSYIDPLRLLRPVVIRLKPLGGR